jgi:hypothetical protein
LAEALQAANQAFDEGCQRRHEVGQKKYGELTFLDNDTVAMAMEEVLDLANYARYTYIKLFLLQQAVANALEEEPDVGREGFVSTKELFGFRTE